MRKRIFPMMVAAGIALLMVTGFSLAAATPVDAQCGSQASSCKNCHEVQGQAPVNNDGTAWHTAHAFGDFCYICHAGNNQATDATAAHTGMVPPLADVKASCMQCHPNDLQERAQVYATALGIELGAGAPAPAPAGQPSTAGGGTAGTATTAGVPAATALDTHDPNLVDYAQRYNEVVLGEKPVNWGNVILAALIGVVAIGGGGFVVTREKLVKLSFGDTRKPDGEYPADVVAMLPALAGLGARSRRALKNVLDNPRKAEKVLGLMDAVVSDEKSEEQP